MVLCIVKTSKFKSLFLLALAGLLSSCSQTPAPTQVTPVTASEITPPPASAEPETVSAQLLFQRARQLQGLAREQQLLAAAQQALVEQDNSLALAIADTLQLSDSAQIRAANHLVLLQAYLQNNELALAEQLLQQTPLTQIPLADRPAFLWASAALQQRQQRGYAAARALLQLDELLANQRQVVASYPELPDHLWQQLSVLDNTELANLKVGAGQRALGWLNLLELVRANLGQPAQLEQALADWRQRYPTLPALADLPVSLQQQLALQPYQPRKIAVLLPLSGQFRQHARAIQYGLLAAAAADQTSGRQLIFLDSQQPIPQLQQQLASQQADFVIGPLLREQVEAISQLTDWAYPTLFLNSRDTNRPAQPDRFYFALNMEDEATQMAQLFARKNYQRPVVISARNAISQRMTQQFSRQWQQLGFEAPESYQFDARDELEALVTRLLEIDNSRERIRLISGLIPGKVETEPHSRKDIDAIYLIADPIQTRMFKPFIDVSVSQHGPRLPVYASSRSFSVGGDANDLRDLNGLTFTETPWLLGEQHIQAVREQYLQLFPDQDETLQRLFAMGYDAFQLIGSLKQQRQLPSLSFPGFTGRLTVSAQGDIQRQLSWASYQTNRLVSVQEP